MLQIERGTVKFFRQDKGYGFIAPDGSGEDVFFHTKYYSGLNEEYPGELRLDFEDDAELVGVYHIPRKGDHIAYRSYRDQRGLMAIHWLYLEALARAEKMLAIRRGSPENAYVRVMKFDPAEDRNRPSVFWKGTMKEFRQRLDDGFSEMRDDRYSIEELRISSKWRRIWHPSEWHKDYKREHRFVDHSIRFNTYPG